MGPCPYNWPKNTWVTVRVVRLFHPLISVGYFALFLGPPCRYTPLFLLKVNNRNFPRVKSQSAHDPTQNVIIIVVCVTV